MRRSVSTKISRRVLSHEWIKGGKKLPQHDGGDTVLFLHGLLGSGRNLRTPAKKLSEIHPNLSILLLDARGHGSSSMSAIAPPGFDPPHTLSNCAQDVIDTVHHLDLVEEKSPIGVVGHSFGGRIALEYLHGLTARAARDDRKIQPPKSTWLLDTVPGRADSSVADVIRAVSSITTPVKSKKDLVKDLTDLGVDIGIASWMTTNLVRAPEGGFDFSFDLEVVLGILEDFPRQDFLSMIGEIGALRDGDKQSSVNLVRAGRNTAWTEEVLREFEGFDSDFFKLHALPDAGHWVHVDDLQGLLQMMRGSFDREDTL